jgi:ATP-dependent Zn protease
VSVYNLDGIYERLAQLVELCGLPPVSEADARQRQDEGEDRLPRAAYHEAGHALQACLEKIEWSRVLVRPDGSGAFTPGRPGPSSRAMWPRLQQRVAIDVGGVVAEAVRFDDVDAAGCMTDLFMALARGGTDEASRADEAGVQLVRAEVKRVRGLFLLHRDALDALAQALLAARTMTRDECVEVLRRSAPDVGPPEYAWECPDDERTRVWRARRLATAEQESRPVLP